MRNEHQLPGQTARIAGTVFWERVTAQVGKSVRQATDHAIHGEIPKCSS